MAMRGTLTHRKTRRLARLLGIPPCFALGILEALWHLTAEQCPDGDVSGLSAEDVADELFYQGDPNKLMESLIGAGWIDETPCGFEHKPACAMYVHDWHIHADSHVHTQLAKRRQCFANGVMPTLVNDAFNAETKARIRAEFLKRYPHLSSTANQVPTTQDDEKPGPDASGQVLDKSPKGPDFPGQVPAIPGTRNQEPDSSEPNGSGEGDASPRARSEPFDSISEVLTQCAAKLDGDPPDREEVARWCKSGSALRKLVDKLGVAKTVDLKVWVTKHKPNGADWNLLWAERNTWLAQMRDGVAFVPRGETGNGKKPPPKSDEPVRPKADRDFWYGPQDDDGRCPRLAIVNGRHTKALFDEAKWFRDRGLDPAQEMALR